MKSMEVMIPVDGNPKAEQPAKWFPFGGFVAYTWEEMMTPKMIKIVDLWDMGGQDFCLYDLDTPTFLRRAFHA